MMEDIVKNMSDPLPIKHQFWKLMIGALAGFAATKLTEKGYDTVFKFFTQREADTDVEERHYLRGLRWGEDYRKFLLQPDEDRTDSA